MSLTRARTLTSINFIQNPAFTVWQRGTSFAMGAGTKTKTCDLWHGYRTAANSSISRQTGFSGSTYCARITKVAASSGTGISLMQQMESVLSTELAGKTVAFSFDARVGSDYSGIVGLTVNLYTGVGTDEAFDASTFTFVSTTTNTVLVATFLPGTTTARYSGVAVVPSDCTEAVIRISLAEAAVAAGTNDYAEVTNLKLEVGTSATAFIPEFSATNMDNCLRRYRKSFLQATAPAQAAGTATGEFRGRAQVSGAAAEYVGRIQFGTTMRVSPSITLYNPTSSNGEVRDQTAAADCSSSASVNITEQSFEITTTGAVGTTAHTSVLGVHWAADAEYA